MVFIDELEQFNNFLKDNALYFLLGAVLILVLAVVLIFLSGRKKNEKQDFEPFYSALGGLPNIKSAESHGSRLAMKLLDYDKVDFEKLKSAGVSNYIKMTDKLTVVIGPNSTILEKAINEKKA
jgi:phosphotransferase system IIB component